VSTALRVTHFAERRRRPNRAAVARIIACIDTSYELIEFQIVVP
jgi:hypothetical protein